MKLYRQCKNCGDILHDGNWDGECRACFTGVEKEPITKPDHYHKGGIDVIGFCKDKLSKERQAGFFQMNVLKYVTRYTEKGTPMEDLRKAEDYLKMLIELEESE